jgi:hypothetical protein
MDVMKTIGAIFIGLSLCVAYFYVMRGYGLGNGMDTVIPFAFTGLHDGLNSQHFHFLGTVWKGRLASLVAANEWLNCWHPTTQESFLNMFGAYFSVWLGATFGLIIWLVKEPVFVLFATFAGLIYGSTVMTTAPQIHAVQFFPWDMPAMFFMTLAFLCWRAESHWLMVATIITGTAFQESVAVLGLLLLFTRAWRPCIAAVIGCLIMRLIVTWIVLGHVQVSTAGYCAAGSEWESIGHFCRWEFSVHLNTILWGSGGMAFGVFVYKPKTVKETGILVTLATAYALLAVMTIMDKDCMHARQMFGLIPMTAVYLQSKLYGTSI